MLSSTIVRGDTAFPLPPVPAGTSLELAKHYTLMARSFASDDTDQWQHSKQAIRDFRPNCGADLATKLIAALHEMAPFLTNGSTGDAAINPGEFPTDLAFQMIAVAVNDALHMDTRSEWNRRLAAFDEARAADIAHAKLHGIDWGLPKEQLEAGYAMASKEVLEEDDRLGDVAGEAEDSLMEWPAPDATAFALKVLLAHGRMIDRYDDIVLAEAKHFSGRASR
ncbi:hypothetical protein [Sphingobium chungbukense]|uniref:Uncharacterized protein n=1 Tax=Sphingobium chungbukense TaxID=56193 RepID=A0A0M3AQT9_9SPHN|nr:hypothetical protein [Sphingobium chungbukense]KKW92268.1 hypothetical protein YP76_10075 [Sphingobium chungbukense]